MRAAALVVAACGLRWRRAALLGGCSAIAQGSALTNRHLPVRLQPRPTITTPSPRDAHHRDQHVSLVAAAVSTACDRGWRSTGRCCVWRGWDRLGPQWPPGSDGEGEFGEDRFEPVAGLGVVPEFVVASAQVLAERVPATDLWVPRTRSPHATCTYSWMRPPSRSRRIGRMAVLECGGVPLAGGR